MYMQSSFSEKTWKASIDMCVCGHQKSKHDSSSRCLVHSDYKGCCPCEQFYSVITVKKD